MSILTWFKNRKQSNNTLSAERSYWTNALYKQCVYNRFRVCAGMKDGVWCVGQQFLESPFYSHPFSAFWVVPTTWGYRAAVMYDKPFYWGDETFADFKQRVANILKNDTQFLTLIEDMKKKNGGKWTW